MSECRRCGGVYGPSEPVTVPLRALPTVEISGIEGQRCSGCGDSKYGVPHMDDLFRVIAGLRVQKPERLSGAEARFLRKWLGWSGQDTADCLGFTIDDYAAWDAQLGHVSKGEPEPLALRMVLEGSTWAGAA